MDASLAKADQEAYLRELLVPCLFNLVAIRLAVTTAGHQRGTRGAAGAKHTEAPSIPITMRALAASPGGAM